MLRTSLKQTILLSILFALCSNGCSETQQSGSSEIDDTAEGSTDIDPEEERDEDDDTIDDGTEDDETGAQGTDDEEAACEETCVFPVADHVDLSYVVWGEEDIHYYVPEPAWAMAATQASRMLAYYFSGRIKDAVSPNWFLALARYPLTLLL